MAAPHADTTVRGERTPLQRSCVGSMNMPWCAQAVQGHENLLFYQLLFVALVLLCLIIHVELPDDSPRVPKTPLDQLRRRQRSKEPKPFAGLIHQPLCEACEHGADIRPKAPGWPPSVMTFTHGRRRTVDTQAHFCPAPDCSYYGWLGRATCVPTAILVLSPGTSSNVSLATGTSIRRMARSFMANTLQPTSSCGSSGLNTSGETMQSLNNSSCCCTHAGVIFSPPHLGLSIRGCRLEAIDTTVGYAMQ